MNPLRKSVHLAMRLTPEEDAQLVRDSAGMSKSDYARWRLFDPHNPPLRTRGKFPVKDHQALSRVLAALGQSHIANNLNQLAAAAHIGALPVTPDIEADLKEASRHIAAMRRMLVEALDLTDDLP